MRPPRSDSREIPGVLRTSHSLFYTYLSEYTVSVLCFFTSVRSTSESLCRSQAIPCLPSKTLYPFSENPIPFWQKPTTLLPKTHEGFAIEIVTGRRQAGGQQAVGRVYPGGDARSSSCLSLYPYQALCGRGIVGLCVRMKMSLGVLGSENFKAQWLQGIRKLWRERVRKPGLCAKERGCARFDTPSVVGLFSSPDHSPAWASQVKNRKQSSIPCRTLNGSRQQSQCLSSKGRPACSRWANGWRSIPVRSP